MRLFILLATLILIAGVVTRVPGESSGNTSDEVCLNGYFISTWNKGFDQTGYL